MVLLVVYHSHHTLFCGIVHVAVLFVASLSHFDEQETKVHRSRNGVYDANRRIDTPPGTDWNCGVCPLYIAAFCHGS
jgi:hypothetical protein